MSWTSPFPAQPHQFFSPFFIRKGLVITGTRPKDRKKKILCRLQPGNTWQSSKASLFTSFQTSGPLSLKILARCQSVPDLRSTLSAWLHVRPPRPGDTRQSSRPPHRQEARKTARATGGISQGKERELREPPSPQNSPGTTWAPQKFCRNLRQGNQCDALIITKSISPCYTTQISHGSLLLEIYIPFNIGIWDRPSESSKAPPHAAWHTWLSNLQNILLFQSWIPLSQACQQCQITCQRK